MLPNLVPWNVFEDIFSPNYGQTQANEHNSHFTRNIKSSKQSNHLLQNADILQIFHELEENTHAWRLTDSSPKGLDEIRIIITQTWIHWPMSACDAQRFQHVPDKWKWINVPDGFTDGSSEVIPVCLRNPSTWTYNAMNVLADYTCLH